MKQTRQCCHARDLSTIGLQEIGFFSQHFLQRKLLKKWKWIFQSNKLKLLFKVNGNPKIYLLDVTVILFILEKASIRNPPNKNQSKKLVDTCFS